MYVCVRAGSEKLGTLPPFFLVNLQKEMELQDLLLKMKRFCEINIFHVI